MKSSKLKIPSKSKKNNSLENESAVKKKRTQNMDDDTDGFSMIEKKIFEGTNLSTPKSSEKVSKIGKLNKAQTERQSKSSERVSKNGKIDKAQTERQSKSSERVSKNGQIDKGQTERQSKSSERVSKNGKIGKAQTKRQAKNDEKTPSDEKKSKYFAVQDSSKRNVAKLECKTPISSKSKINKLKEEVSKTRLQVEEIGSDNVENKKIKPQKDNQRNKLENSEQKFVKNAKNIESKRKKTNKLEGKTNIKLTKSEKSSECRKIVGQHNSSKKKPQSSSKRKPTTEPDSDSSDFEEVDELTQLLNNKEDADSKIIKIELKAENTLWGMKKKKKKTEQELFEDYLRKQMNRNVREIQENVHKAHLLCLFAHGRFLNRTLNSPTLMGAALSIVTSRNLYPPKRLNLTHLKQLLHWYTQKIPIHNDLRTKADEKLPWVYVLSDRFEKQVAYCNKELVHMFVVLGRALGMNVRLVMNLQPLSWKPSGELLIKPPKKENSDENMSDEEFKEEKKKLLMPDIIQDLKKNKRTNKSTSKKRKNSSDVDSDSDFERDVKLKKGNNKSSNKCKSEKINRDSSKNKKKKIGAVDEWVEVYVEEEEKWICIDINKNKMYCMEDIRSRASAPLAYVTAFNVNLTVKDVTKRYVSNWLVSEKKIRLDSSWWQKALSSFCDGCTTKGTAEDKELEANIESDSLPKTVGEFKNHPRYALQRHLLKFEAFYPPDIQPISFFKGEGVFPRECVKTLRGREYWIKEALVVKVGEEPYKVVKARPKWDKVKQEMVKDLPLEVFGEWQVEDYDPPTAIGGKVPRNEFGNVELFKPCMIPKGCVHVPDMGTGFAKLARRLGIDCVTAIVGFEFHKGGSHPTYEGYVICEESKDTLMDAWEEEKREIAKREEEKRVKRIYDNWKRLINGMIVKDRIATKYGVKSTDKSKKTPKKKVKQVDLDEQAQSISVNVANEVKEKPTKDSRTKETEEEPIKISGTKVCLSIDLDASIESKMKSTSKMKPNGSLSESEEELDAAEHEKKVERILSQNKFVAPNLSDESGDECENEQSEKKSQSDDECESKPREKKNKTNSPYFRNVQNEKTKKRKSSNEHLPKFVQKKKSRRNGKKDMMGINLSESSDSDDNSASTNLSSGSSNSKVSADLNTRRSGRNARKIIYVEKKGSETDLSFSCDDDCDDS